MTEQMRPVELRDDVDGYYIDGQPYSFAAGDEVVVPRTVAGDLVRINKAVYAGDVFEVDDEDYEDAIGASDGDDGDVPAVIAEGTVDELEEYLDENELEDERLKTLLEAEQKNRNRTTAVEAIEERLDE